MTELGAERDQSTNENNDLDQNIIDLSLQKNMVINHCFFVFKFINKIFFQIFRC